MQKRTLNNQTEIKVGDKVRSHDFSYKFKDGTYDRIDLEGELACYVEGVVVDIAPAPIGQTCNMYHIKITKKIFGGEDITNGREGNDETFLEPYLNQINYAPVNGTQSLMGKTYGVELV